MFDIENLVEEIILSRGLVSVKDMKIVLGGFIKEHEIVEQGVKTYKEFVEGYEDFCNASGSVLPAYEEHREHQGAV